MGQAPADRGRRRPDVLPGPAAAPEKYVQALLAAHQILQGNCGGPSVPDLLAWYGIQPGDNGEYKDSLDARSWAQWHEEGLA